MGNHPWREQSGRGRSRQGSIRLGLRDGQDSPLLASFSIRSIKGPPREVLTGLFISAFLHASLNGCAESLATRRVPARDLKKAGHLVKVSEG